MSTFLDKSQQNLNAGDLLIKNGLPNSSVHCSYYATVQCMLHIVFKVMGKTQIEFDTEKRYNKEGTHSWAEKIISKELQKKSFSDYKWFKSKFPELKKIRENADYTEFNISKDLSLSALDRSATIINTLKNNFRY